MRLGRTWAGNTFYPGSHPKPKFKRIPLRINSPATIEARLSSEKAAAWQTKSVLPSGRASAKKLRFLLDKTRSCLYLQLLLIHNNPFGSPRERFIYHSIHEHTSKVIYNANSKFDISGTFYSCPHCWATLISTLLMVPTLFGSVQVSREDLPMHSTTGLSITPSPWHVKAKATSHESLSSPTTLLSLMKTTFETLLGNLIEQEMQPHLLLSLTTCFFKF